MLEDLDVSATAEGAWPKNAILTDEGLSYLRGLESLRELRYQGARVTDDGFPHLEGLHNLEVLSLECREATDEGLKSLAKLDHLESLTLLNGIGMTGEGLGALPDPSRLRRLRIDLVTDGGMRTIARFANLRELSIRGWRFRGDGPKDRAILSNVGVDGLKNLLALRNLERLTIVALFLDNWALETVVGKMTGLKELHIDDCPIRVDALKHLRGLKELEVLSVCGTKVDDASVAYLGDLPKLRVLLLEHTSVTALGLPQLLRIQSLEGLCVSFAMTPEHRKEMLEALPKLGWIESPDGLVEFEGEGRKSYSAQLHEEVRKAVMARTAKE
jgi:hypothetical protein